MPVPNSGCRESIKREEMASTHERAALRARFARRTRYLRHHRRLFLAILLGIIADLVLPTSIGRGRRLLAAFDFGAVPGHAARDYWDSLYFSFVSGMTFYRFSSHA